MKSWGRFAVIFIAYSIALLHTAIPHQHPATADGKLSVTPMHCVTTSSVGSLLAMVFSTDLGKGHLETFQKGDNAGSVLQFIAALFIAGFLFVLQFSSGTRTLIGETASHFAEKFYKQRILFSARAFRAPPALAHSLA